MDYQQQHGYDAGGSESAKYLRKRVRAGDITVDFDDLALVVNYEVEATVLSDFGEEIQKDRKSHARRIKVNKMTVNSNIPQLAENMLEKCAIIPPNKLQHVENLLYSLQQRMVKEANRRPTEKEWKREKKQRERKERTRESKEEKRKKEVVVVATMSKLDDYLDDLYDENKQVETSAKVLELAKNVGNLEELVQNNSLMSVLARLLREDHKRNSELVFNILSIFFAMSNFIQLHSFILHHTIGKVTLQVLKFELKRYQVRRKEMEALRTVAEAQKEGKEPEFDPRKPDKRGQPIDIEKEEQKTKFLTKKQDRILYMGFHLLLNLAEDVKVERKMVKKGTVEHLVCLLERTNAELLILAVNFLKKLSVFEENKNRMLETPIVEHVIRFIPCSNAQLMNSSLRLLFNLSFDSKARERMVKGALLPKLVELLKKPQFRAVSLKLMYHLSQEDRCKSMFTYTDAIPYIMQLIVNFPKTFIAKELVALAINLSLNAKNAELMVKGSGLKMLMDRVCRTYDPLLMKVVRNVSRWTLHVQEHVEKGQTYRQRTLWPQFVQPLVRLAKNCDNHDLLVEVLGTLANITPKDLGKETSFADVIINYGLVEFMQKLLVPGFANDDVVLQVVMLIGEMCQDEDAARLLSNSPLMKLLHELIHDKQDDNEIVLQTLFSFYRLLSHNDTAHELLYETKMPRDVCNMLQHDNKVVRAISEALLELVCYHDEMIERSHLNAHDGHQLDGLLVGHISKMVRAKRFQLYNHKWIEMVEQDDNDESEFEGKDDDSQFLEDSRSTFDGGLRSPGDDAAAYYYDDPGKFGAEDDEGMLKHHHQYGQADPSGGGGQQLDWDDNGSIDEFMY